MGRIRTIKPEITESVTLGRVSRDARLLFILLLTRADDHGTCSAHSRVLASVLFPFDDDAIGSIEGWLTELEGVGAIRLYEVEGVRYLNICNWLKHQKIDRIGKPKYPLPEDHPRESSRVLASPRESSRNIALDQGSRIKDQGPGDVREAHAIDRPVDNLPEPKLDQLAPTADPQALDEWRRHRIAVNKPLRAHELIAVGKTLTGIGDAKAQRAVIQNCIANGWLNIRQSDRPSPPGQAPPNPDAERAWAELIASDGANRSPRMQLALDAVGGWQTVRGRTAFTEQKIRAAFVRAFVEAVQ